MRLLREILDRLVLLAAILLAACIPSYIVQYRQRLGGRLDQVHADIAPFQAIANRNFGGSLQKMIDYHLASQDSTFHQEGAALQSLVDAAARLQEAMQGLNTDLLHQCLYLIQHPDHDMLQATWGLYQPGFTLTVPGILFAFSVGVVVWLLFLTCWHGTAAAVRARRRRSLRAVPRRVGEPHGLP